MVISGCGTAAGRKAPDSAPAGQPDTAQQRGGEKIIGTFFYDEMCELCNEDVNRFISILERELPLEVRDRYPHSFEISNIYRTGDRAHFIRVTDELGIEREKLSFPLMILGGKVFQGFENIQSNIREAYFTAAEDQYVYNRPYSPGAGRTGENLFADYSVNPNHVTIIYFYRIECPSCEEIKPLIDNLPAEITVNGRRTPLDIVRMNTRSGNNNERVMAFFEKYEVPDNERQVPIIFLADSWLSGAGSIREGLADKLGRMPAENFIPELIPSE